MRQPFISAIARSKTAEEPTEFGARSVLARHSRQTREPGELAECDAVLFDFTALAGLIAYLDGGHAQPRELLRGRPGHGPIVAGRVNSIGAAAGRKSRGIAALPGRRAPDDIAQLAGAADCILAEGEQRICSLEQAFLKTGTIVMTDVKGAAHVLHVGQEVIIDPSAGIVLDVSRQR